ncbi:hypothetical protein B0T22DRAFT_515784 [Podospora appendiculata]|uniref:Uncharacterized protein n=1 Tax=Podospora appendiculata TaxID=314037 RepID=A0AAE0XCZ1_9PEZI|nr:hypothetical protein B0T22DRAFT_515784 [Podospora appendiculata]
MSQPGANTPSGPPYLPRSAPVGGIPEVKVDAPISAVFILLFLLAALFMLTAIHADHVRTERHPISILLVVFCALRITALAIRIAWATQLTNLNLAIAGNVFTLTGVVILYVVNLLLTRRLLAEHVPHPAATRRAFAFLIFCVAACLIMAVSATVDTFFTTKDNVLRSARDVQLCASTILLALTVVPIPAVVAVFFVYRRPGAVAGGEETRFRARCRLIVITALLLTLEAGFRCGTAFDARPLGQAAWFHHKACLYCLNFLVELLVVYQIVFARLDGRFRGQERREGRKQDAVSEEPAAGRAGGFVDRFNAEWEIFGGRRKGGAVSA